MPDKKRPENRRREFIKCVGVGAAVGAAGVAGVLGGAPSKVAAAAGEKQVRTGNAIQWRMATAWPAGFPILGEGAENFSRWVGEMSGGRLNIRILGEDDALPPLTIFNAVSNGEIEMGNGASYFWAHKSPAMYFFSAVPFGLNAQALNTWLYSGGGMALWDEVYARFNLKPFPAGNTGMQMGGWFNRKINTMEDLKGLKMRIGGLGARVLERAGGKPVVVDGREIRNRLAGGLIHATEWAGPYHDLEMGLHKTARYYYYPGWQESGTGIEAMVNLDAWKSLPADLKAIVEAAASRCNTWMLAEYEERNSRALKTLVSRNGVQLRRFPKPVLQGLERIARTVVAEAGGADRLSRRVYASYRRFQSHAAGWQRTSEEMYQL
ncbi:MAG: TRAP transporter substrate-binding protein [Desulfobacter sp.]|nr:MAG: TRAP transporter substrate-binding protein [Desulfobacter sp.]